MRIQQVEGHGFRGLDGVVPLAAKTVLRGAVGTGKSSVLDAIAWAVLGYVPRFGKTKTAGLFSREEALVVVSLDDGSAIQRRAVTFKGSVSTTVHFERGSEVLEGAAAQAAILALLGGSEESAAELLDVRSLIGAAPSVRTERVESILAAAAPDPALLMAKAGALTVLRLTGGESAKLPSDVEALRTLARAAGQGLDAEARKPAAEAWGAMPEVLKTKGIVAAFEFAKVRKLEHRADAKRLGSMVDATYVPVPAERLATLRKTRDDLARQAGAGKGAADAAKRARETAERAKSLRALADDGALAKSIEEERAHVAAAEPAKAPSARPFALSATAKAERDRLLEEARRATDAAAVQRASLTPMRDVSAEEAAVEKAGQAADAAERVLADATGSAWTVLREGPLEALRVSIETLGAAFDAPEIADVVAKLGPVLEAVDGQRGVSSAAAREKADAAAADLEAAILARDEVLEANEAARARAAVVKGLEEESAEKVRQAETIVETARREHDAREREALAAWRKAEEDRAGLLSKRKASLARMETDLGLRRTAAERAEAEASEAARAAAAAGAPAAGAPDVAEALAKAERALADAEAAAAKATAQEEARAGAARAKALEVAFAAVEWAVGKVRDEAVADRAAPVTSAMREVLHLAGWGSREPYLRAGKGTSGPEFGWVDDGAERSVADLSGGETAVFMAALAVALARVRKVELPLLLVEAEGVVGDEEVVAALLAGLGSLEDVQAVVAGRLPQVPEPWNVVEFPLAEPEPAGA